MMPVVFTSQSTMFLGNKTHVLKSWFHMISIIPPFVGEPLSLILFLRIFLGKEFIFFVKLVERIKLEFV